MPKKKNFNEPQSSSDEENPVVDMDSCTDFQIETAFPLKYKIASESAVSLKRVYVLSLASDKSFGRIAAGLSNNCVQIYDIKSEVLRRTNSQTGSGVVCGLQFLDETANTLLVGSTSGDVNLLDLRTNKVEHTFEDTESPKKPITCFDISANRQVLCLGTDQVQHDVYLLFFDIRGKTAMGGYWECHQDDITDVKFHPTNTNLICTGSTDGLINFFDISEKSEDDALISTINTESSVHKLNWHKNVYEKDIISCITHTNDFKSYDYEEGVPIAEFNRRCISEAIKRTSVVDCNLVSCHNMSDGEVFLLATSNYKKGEAVRSVQLQNKNLLPLGNFIGNKQIIRESLYDAKSNRLVTGGESGIVTLWSPSTDQNAAQSGSKKLKMKSKESRNRKSDPY